jgi:hypothetical protein
MISFRVRRQRRADLARLRNSRDAGIERRKAGAKCIVRRVRWSRQVFRVALTTQLLINVDVLFQRQRGVEHLLHGIHPIGFDVPLDLPRMARRVLDDMFAALILAAAEQQIVVGEVCMTQHVGGD